MYRIATSYRGMMIMFLIMILLDYCEAKYHTSKYSLIPFHLQCAQIIPPFCWIVASFKSSPFQMKVLSLGSSRHYTIYQSDFLFSAKDSKKPPLCIKQLTAFSWKNWTASYISDKDNRRQANQLLSLWEIKLPLKICLIFR